MRRSQFVLVFFILISVSLPSSAQHYIGMSFSEIAKDFKEEKGSVMDREQSLLTFAYNDAAAGMVQLKFRFDGDGKCFFEEYEATCDSCMKNVLKSILAKEKYGWIKINENQYVSRFKEYLMIELPVENGDYSFSVFRTEWSKQSYKMLTGSDQ